MSATIYDIIRLIYVSFTLYDYSAAVERNNLKTSVNESSESVTLTLNDFTIPSRTSFYLTKPQAKESKDLKTTPKSKTNTKNNGKSTPNQKKEIKPVDDAEGKHLSSYLTIDKRGHREQVKTASNQPTYLVTTSSKVKGRPKTTSTTKIVPFTEDSDPFIKQDHKNVDHKKIKENIQSHLTETTENNDQDKTEIQSQDITDTRYQEIKETQVENTTKTQGQDTTKTQGQDKTETQGQDTTESQAEDTTETHGQDTTESQAEDTTERHVEETTKMQGQDTTETHGQDTTESQAEDTTERHVEETTKMQGQDTTETRGQDTAETQGQDTIESQGQDTTEINGYDATESFRTDNKLMQKTTRRQPHEPTDEVVTTIFITQPRTGSTDQILDDKSPITETEKPSIDVTLGATQRLPALSGLIWWVSVVSGAGLGMIILLSILTVLCYRPWRRNQMKQLRHPPKKAKENMYGKMGSNRNSKRLRGIHSKNSCYGKISEKDWGDDERYQRTQSVFSWGSEFDSFDPLEEVECQAKGEHTDNSFMLIQENLEAFNNSAASSAELLADTCLCYGSTDIVK